MAQLAEACLQADFAAARAIQRKFLPLMDVNFIESNPMPVKWALSRMGLLKPVFRLPMVPPGEAAQAKIEKVLKSTRLV
jgi:4-hydroxy-tetrahydrodipicolinate synthase